MLVAKRTSWFFFPVYLYSLISGLTLFGSTFGPYIDFPSGMMRIAIEKNSAYTFIALLLSGLVLAFLPRSFKRVVPEIMVLTLLTGSAWTWLSLDRVPYERGTLSGNASMHGCLLAGLLPYLFYCVRSIRLRVVFCAFVVGAIALLQAVVPIVVLAATLVAYLISHRRIRLKWITLTGAIGLLACMIIPLFYNLDLLGVPDSGRFKVWFNVMRWWKSESSVWLGAGLGSGRSLFPYIQSVTQTTVTEFFLWLHSDWLQSLFELGLIGMSFALVAYFYVVLRAYGRPHLFATLISLSTTALFNYPLRLPLHVAVLVLTVWLILQARSEDHPRQRNQIRESSV